MRPVSVLSLLNPLEMGGTGRERRGGKDCAKRNFFGKEEERRKEKICVFKCSVLATVPACPLPLFSSRLFPPRVYTKGGGKEGHPTSGRRGPGKRVTYAQEHYCPSNAAGIARTRMLKNTYVSNFKSIFIHKPRVPTTSYSFYF